MINEAFYAQEVILPSKFSWRNYNGENFVTPVRDQGSCGSCWAFATTAALDSQALIAKNKPGIDLDLSEQIVLSCSGGGSCGGGYPSTASDFLRDYGTNLEGCYLYTATNGNCSSACSGWPSKAYRLSSWSYVNAGTTASETAMKNAIYTSGPVAVWFKVYTDFYYYSSGVYHYTWGSYEGNHIVLVVGWNDSIGAFIAKNSWGTEWGESGYFKIAYSELAGNTLFGYWTYAYGGAVFPVNLLLPNGGEVIPSGSNYLTQWSANSYAVKFKLKYSLDNGSTWSLIDDNLTGTSFYWPVPKPANNKTQCLVKIIGYDASDAKIGSDSSNSSFTIEVVKLTTPSDTGISMTSGSTYDITWTTNATKNPVAKVKLYYTKDNGITWLPITTFTGSNPGTYNWTVPNVASMKTNCKVKVKLKDSAGNTVGSDVSDNNFTIEP